MARGGAERTGRGPDRDSNPPGWAPRPAMDGCDAVRAPGRQDASFVATMTSIDIVRPPMMRCTSLR